MYPTIIDIKYWDENQLACQKSKIFLFTDSTKDAAEKVSDYFGEDNILTLTITFFGECNCGIEVDEDFVQKYLDALRLENE